MKFQSSSPVAKSKKLSTKLFGLYSEESIISHLMILKRYSLFCIYIFPFRYPIKFDTLSFEGITIHKYTWLMHTTPAIISTFLYLHSVAMISQTSSHCFPYSTFFSILRNKYDMVLAFSRKYVIDSIVHFDRLL